MVHFFEVCQFVYDDVLLHNGGCEKEATGEIEDVVGGAATPVGGIEFEAYIFDKFLKMSFVDFVNLFFKVVLLVLGYALADEVGDGLVVEYFGGGELGIEVEVYGIAL
jgi:hypothetical protein